MKARTERIHSLDALRAIMMLLGIVLHAAISYCVYDQGRTWPLKDLGAATIVIDFIVGYIRIFRMPIFFVVAGFFGALLYYERSAHEMLMNRFKRILLPFIVFVFLLWPFLGIGYLYTFEAFNGHPPPDAGGEFHIGMLIPTTTFHLWFLHYLCMITVIVVAGVKLEERFRFLPNEKVVALMGNLLTSTLKKVTVLALLIFVVLLLMSREWVGTTNFFTPNWKTLLFYTTFYTFGWGLYHARAYLDTFKENDGVLFLLSLILSGIALWQTANLGPELKAFVNAWASSLCIFGITGLFVRYCSQASFRMRYLSDASYWVYIIHMFFALVGPGMLAEYAWHGLLKFAIVSLVTTIIAFVSYHYLVRATFVGKFLNGRKYEKVSLREFINNKPTI